MSIKNIFGQNIFFLLKIVSDLNTSVGVIFDAFYSYIYVYEQLER